MTQVQSNVVDIKFGTDGWRAIIADEFTVDNVARVAEGTAHWLHKNYNQPTVVIGHDCRFAGDLFAETVTKILTHHDIKVFLAEGFVSTPMVSYGIVHKEVTAGIIITASHNPPSYNGFKLRGYYGGAALPSMIEEMETLIPDHTEVPETSLVQLKEQGKCENIDLEQIYCDRVEEQFDLQAIRDKVKFGFDAMYGTGQRVIPRLFDNVKLLRCEHNPTFYGQPPEPIHKNLEPLSKLLQQEDDLDCGIAVDGDADRISMYDKQGNYVDSHHIILLLIHYLCKYKEMEGKVVAAFSVTEKIKKLCDHYDLPLEITPVGFKHIAQIMTKEDVLLGGEESGGIAISSHIPERDGIWMGLTLLEFMAKKEKSLTGLIEEVYEIVGSFAYQRDDLEIDESLKQEIMEKCANNEFKQFGDYEIQRVEDIDGYKFFVSDDEWVMIRPSGTEPVLRVYVEAANEEKVADLLQQTRQTILPEN